MQYIESPNKHEGRIKDLRLIVWHDMEMPEYTSTAERCANYFASPKAGVSAHLCADPDSVVECVKPEDTAWHAPGANADGYGVELAGKASQLRADWLDDASKATIRQAAKPVVAVMKAHAIPMKWLTDAELADGKTKGHTTHAQVTRVFKKSSHTDPGKGFPTDFVTATINALLHPAPKPAPKPATKPTGPAPLKVDGDLGKETIKRWQQIMKTPVDGEISKPSALIKAVQEHLNHFNGRLKTDGVLGELTIKAIQRYLGVEQDGHMGSVTVKHLQERLNHGKF